ncbi:hypothetical protein M0813_27571 [Anaeramoeba flamelloides]|uniref:Uncharacterized protein n=1 Tax=Anaeramoeba flamelloides TaxID=1746091 RepID=A0ABQ8XW38_9EUKA|nr:hypothetical protein M0813_27571 [Anaeramoeba flamelloides]
MNQLQKAVSSPLPIRSNNTKQQTIRSQSDHYFNRFSRLDLIQPQPKKNFPSQRFKNKRFLKYDFSKELSQFITPINGFIEMSIENSSKNEFEQDHILEELLLDKPTQNTKNMKKEKDLFLKNNEVEEDEDEERMEEMIGYNLNEKEQELAFSPPLRSKCPLWQDNKFRRMLNFENRF